MFVSSHGKTDFNWIIGMFVVVSNRWIDADVQGCDNRDCNGGWAHTILIASTSESASYRRRRKHQPLRWQLMGRCHAAHGTHLMSHIIKVALSLYAFSFITTYHWLNSAFVCWKMAYLKTKWCWEEIYSRLCSTWQDKVNDWFRCGIRFC